MEKKILIVEDQAMVAMTIEAELGQLGYTVAGIAATGEGAINLAREKKPDLILMDINLEGEMDGIAAAEQIQLFLDSPIIYLTAYSDEETLQRAGMTTPFTYLTKPYKLRDLHSNIEMALYKKKIALTSDLRERRLQILLKRVADPLIATDENGLIIFINEMASDLIGIDPFDALEQPLDQVFRVKENKENQLFLKSNQEGPDTPGILGFPFQCTLTNHEAKEIPILTSTSTIKNRENNYGGLFLVFRDCRPNIEARHRVAELETNTRTMLDAIIVPMVIIGPDLRIEDYNSAFEEWCRKIGITTDIRNKNIKNIAGLLKTLRPAQLNQVLETNLPVIFEEQIAIGKETLVYVVRFVPLSDNGVPKHLLITLSDNTADQKQKMEGIIPVTENKRLIENIIGHFSAILRCLIEIRSLSLMEDPSVEKDWISEQIVRHIEKAELQSSELYEIFLKELSGKHTFQQVYEQNKKQVEREHEYVIKPRK